MSTCFYNGNFINTSNFDEVIDMLIVKNGKISYKGKYKKSLAKKCRKTINLEGKTLIPGFNDSHMHLLGLGIALDQLDLSDVESITELIDKSKKFIKNKDLTILEGRGWNQKKFIDKRMPTRKDLDKISTEIPIVLKRACGHILVCNSNALALID
ncbi:MAG: amidohydrolase family protein, partial [Bacillota bacterium]